MLDITQIDARIDLLERYRADVLAYFNGTDSDELRRRVNRNALAARTAVAEVNCYQSLTIAPGPAIGGLIAQNIDPFTSVFESFHGISVIPKLATMVEQAIGVYEHLKKDTGLVRLPTTREAIDLEGALERALRPHFRKGPPGSEREVQDAVEDVLHTLGIEFHREKETVPVGPRASKPDFTIPGLELALEVKLARGNHSPSQIQEEISADVALYRTRWQRLLFVIYDLGVIDDPYRMRQENVKHFGVSVVIVKQ